jgi:hypothetical protein
MQDAWTGAWRVDTPFDLVWGQLFLSNLCCFLINEFLVLLRVSSTYSSHFSHFWNCMFVFSPSFVFPFFGMHVLCHNGMMFVCIYNATNFDNKQDGIFSVQILMVMFLFCIVLLCAVAILRCSNDAALIVISGWDSTSFSRRITHPLYHLWFTCILIFFTCKRMEGRTNLRTIMNHGVALIIV